MDLIFVFILWQTSITRNHLFQKHIVGSITQSSQSLRFKSRLNYCQESIKRVIWHCFLYWHVDWNRQEELDKSVGRIMEHPSYLLHILCCACLIYLPFIAVRDLIFFCKKVIHSSAKIPGLNISTFSLVFWTQRFLIDFGKQYCGKF